MAKQQDTITHFSHTGHELVKRHYTGPFRCDMCWEDLSGPAYGCRAGCDFAIHDSCAGHPQTTFFTQAHPHPLVLLQTRRDVAAHGCGICGGRCAPGCFLYRCPPCGFDMHPRCTKLPTAVRSARHPAHDLTLAAAEGRSARGSTVATRADSTSTSRALAPPGQASRAPNHTATLWHSSSSPECRARPRRRA